MAMTELNKMGLPVICIDARPGSEADMRRCPASIASVEFDPISDMRRRFLLRCTPLTHSRPAIVSSCSLALGDAP